jgi:hypothetical protein
MGNLCPASLSGVKEGGLNGKPGRDVIEHALQNIGRGETI